MAKKSSSDVAVWLGRETPHVRKSLENASRHFDGNDNLTVNTLEAVYAQESSFGSSVRKRGSSGAAGHFQFESRTAKEYSLTVTKENDQRFDIDYASSAAARYLSDFVTLFSKTTKIREGAVTIVI